MKSIITDSFLVSESYRISNLQSMHIIGGVGKVDRDKEEQEDLPEVSNGIPDDYSAYNRHSRPGN